MADILIMPQKIFSGRNALEVAEEAIKGLGEKPLIVSDPVMKKIGNVDIITNILEKLHRSYAEFTDISGEPDDGMVEAGLKLYREESCDCLIGLGGGSPIDTMKAIAMLSVYGGRVSDCMETVITKKLPAMAAVPTTSGTGSEATQFTIITDRNTQVKMLLKGSAMMPDIAIIDPRFPMTAPPSVTAATGVDALTHAIEAYTSKKAQPLSDVFARSACRRIFENLRKVWKNGSDEESRAEMSLAALEAGIAFNNSSVTIVHGMSRPIGALFHVPHGISNAMLLEVCLRFAVGGAQKRFAELSRVCGFASDSEGEQEAAQRFLEQVSVLLHDIEIPTLETYGIDHEEFCQLIPKMAADAVASGSPSNTRRETSPEIIEELYRKLWERKEGRNDA